MFSVLVLVVLVLVVLVLVVLVLVVLVLGRNPKKNILFSESLGDKMASECFTIVDDVVVVVLDWKFYLNFFFLKIFEFYFFFSKNK